MGRSKFISKKVWGTLLLIQGMIMAALQGGVFYNPDSNTILFLLGTGITLMGFDAAQHYKDGRTDS